MFDNRACDQAFSVQVMSTSDKPRLAGRQPSSAVGCSGWRPGRGPTGRGKCGFR